MASKLSAIQRRSYGLPPEQDDVKGIDNRSGVKRGFGKIMSGQEAAKDRLASNRTGMFRQNAGFGSAYRPVHSYDEGTDRPDAFNPDAPHQLIDLPAGSQVLSPTESAALETAGVTGSMFPKATASASAQPDPESQIIADQRATLTDRGGKAIESGNIVELGKAALGHRALDEFEKANTPAAQVAAPIMASAAQAPPAPTQVAPKIMSAPTMAETTGLTRGIPKMYTPPEQMAPGAEGSLAQYTADQANVGRNMTPEQKEKLYSEAQRAKEDLRRQMLSSDPTVLGQAQYQLAALDKLTPWGSPGSAHPGFWGKLAHTLAQIGEYGADVFAPGASTIIPGSRMNIAAREQGGLERMQLGQKMYEEQAQTANLRAEAYARQHPEAKHLGNYTGADGKEHILFQTADGVQDIAGGAVEGKEEDKAVRDYIASHPKELAGMSPEQQRDEARKQLKSESRYPRPMTGPEHTFYDDKSGKTYQLWDMGNGQVQLKDIQTGQPYSEPKTVPTAKPKKPAGQSKLPTGYGPLGEVAPSQEKKLSPTGFPILGEMAALGGPGSAAMTGLFPELKSVAQMNQERQAAKQAATEGRAETKEDTAPVIAYDEQGRAYIMPYGDAKRFEKAGKVSSVIAAPPGEYESAREKLSNANAYAQTITNYQQDFPKLRDKLPASDFQRLELLTSHLKESIVDGVLGEVPLLGPPLGAASKIFTNKLQREAWQDLSPEGKRLLSEYYTTVIDNFANMKAIMGSVGRNEIQLQAEVNTIPLPQLDTQSAKEQFDAKIGDLKARFNSLYHMKNQPFPFEDTGKGKESDRKSQYSPNNPFVKKQK